jgi:thiol-disulfide isomerase/thioredoxin
MTQPTLKIRPIAISICIAVLFGLAVFYLTSPPSGKSVRENTQADAQAAANTGGRLAAYATGTLADMLVHPAPKELPEIRFFNADKKQQGLADFAGEVLVINFWATWCAPCRAEMPALEALQKHFDGRNMRVLAISLDRGKPEKPKAFLAELNLTALDFYHDPKNASARAIGAFGLPTTLIVDQTGKELARLPGEAEWDAAEVVALIEALLNEEKLANNPAG